MPTTKDGSWMITAFDIADGKICYGQARHTSEKAYKNDLTQKSKPNVGDILITKDGTLGRIAVVDRTAICINQSVACLRPLLDTDVRFLVHYLRSDIGQERMLADAGGSTIKHIYITKLTQMEVPVPPREERTRISDILDTIDEAIAHTSSLIAKLKQMKAGLLHDLLTRGLDENGELRDAIAHPKQFKDSPLGLIPKGWTVSSVEGEFDITTGFTLGEHRRPRKNKRKYLRVANVQREEILLNDIAELEAEDREFSSRLLEKDDLLIVEGHANPDEIGRCAIVPTAAVGLTFQNHLFRLRYRDIQPKFALAWLNSEWFRAYWRRLCGTSSGLNTINRTMLNAIPVPIPEEKEQSRIIAVFDTYKERIRTEEAYRDKLKFQK